MKTNNTNKNTFVYAAGAVAVVGLLAWLGKKLYNKEVKQLSEAKEAEDRVILEGLGVAPERMREEVLEARRPEDQNIVKGAYVGIESNPDWDEKVVDPEETLQSSSVLHITEETWGKYGQKYLTLLFEIPNISGGKGSFNVPRAGDYYTAMKALKDYLWGKVVVFCKEPRGNMAVYLAYSYPNPRRKEGDDPNVTEILEVPREIWSLWANEHDGVVEFYEDVQENGVVAACESKEGALDKIQDLINDSFVAKYPEVDPSTVKPTFEEAILMYKMTFQEAGEREIGITVKSLLDSLKYIYDEFVICRKGRDESENDRLRKRGVKYQQFMFHAPNEDGQFDSLTRYYTIDKNRRVIVKTYSYPEDD